MLHLLARTCRALLVAAVAAAVAIPAITHEAPYGADMVGVDQVDRSGNEPTWTPAYAARFPGCTDRTRLGDVVVVDQMNHARRISFDDAWARGRDSNHANDVWVVGWCGR